MKNIKRKLTDYEKIVLFENLRTANTKQFLTVVWWDMINPNKNFVLVDSINNGMRFDAAYKKAKKWKKALE